jgi:hypothetical protein
MMIGMLVSGIGLILAGLLAIGYGIQYKEFSVGSTLILAGAVGVCTGIVMFGLWAAVRELRDIAQRLGGGLSAEPAAAIQPGVAADARPAAPGVGGRLFGRYQPPSPDAAEPAALIPFTSPPPWHEEAATRDRGRSEAPSAAAPAGEPGVAEAAPKRRNLLFSSSRKERERAQARTSEPLTPDFLSSELRPNLPSASPAPEASEPPATFEDAWPKAERARLADIPPRRTARTPSTFETSDTPAPSPDRHPPVPREEQQAPVTILKSGVVDGMAYSLYSDGSIEAQMPEGMMRFASIDELRTHLDQRS